MQIRSITSYDTEKNTIRVHFNHGADPSLAAGPEQIKSRSRLKEFKHRRERYHHKSDDPVARIKKAFRFVVEKERFRDPTIITDAVEDKHYFFPDLRQGKIYHFCVTEPTLEKLVTERNGVFEELKKRYNRGEKKTKPTAFKLILGVHERLKQQVIQREKRQNGLELDFANALYMPIKGFVSGDVKWKISDLIKTLNSMLAYYDEYIPPDEETIQRSLEQLEERFAQQERALQLRRLRREREELFIAIEAMVKSGDNATNPEKFHGLVDNFNQVVVELDKAEKPALKDTDADLPLQQNLAKGKEEYDASEEEMPADFFDEKDDEPEFAQLQIRLDDLNDLIELQTLLGNNIKNKAAFEALVEERNQILPKIELARERMQEQADTEEQRLLLQNIEEQLAKGPDINELVEKTAALDTRPVVNNLFGNRHNFFKKPELTLWQRFCGFFRRLFCCTRPECDDEIQYQPISNQYH